jgi:hypothetical protein
MKAKISHSVITSIRLEDGRRLTLNINQEKITLTHANKRGRMILTLGTWEDVMQRYSNWEKELDAKAKEVSQ